MKRLKKKKNTQEKREECNLSYNLPHKYLQNILENSFKSSVRGLERSKSNVTPGIALTSVCLGWEMLPGLSHLSIPYTWSDLQSFFSSSIAQKYLLLFALSPDLGSPFSGDKLAHFQVSSPHCVLQIKSRIFRSEVTQIAFLQVSQKVQSEKAAQMFITLFL